MTNVNNYNKINRFWGSNSVSAARKVAQGMSTSQKAATCAKLNNLLREHHNDGITVIKALVAFKNARNDSWFCAGRADPSDHLGTIEAALNKVGSFEYYPTLKELEVLVKNSSYFVQRDIPTHFKDFLKTLKPNDREEIGNSKFLQDNGIIDKPNNNSESIIKHDGEGDSSFSKIPKNWRNVELYKSVSIVEIEEDQDELCLVGAHSEMLTSSIENLDNVHIKRPPLATDIENALFKTNTGTQQQLEAIDLEITQEIFDNVKQYYLSLIEDAHTEYSKQYSANMSYPDTDFID